MEAFDYIKKDENYGLTFLGGKNSPGFIVPQLPSFLTNVVYAGSAFHPGPYE